MRQNPLYNITQRQELDNQIGYHNKEALHKKVEELHKASSNPKEFGHAIQDLHDWSAKKLEETKQPFWKKFSSVIEHGIKAGGCLLQGREQAGFTHFEEMKNAVNHLFGKSQTFSKTFEEVNQSTKSFVARLEAARKGNSKDGPSIV